VPDAFDLSMTYAKPSSIYCPPPSKLTDTVAERMTEGSLLFNYVGHGFAKGLDSLRWADTRIPIMRASDVKRLGAPNETEPRQIPIAFMSCCSVGWYDLPRGDHSFAEALLFHPCGPAAVIAGSRVTHPYANTVLQMDITRTLLVDRAPTAGQLDLCATRSLLTIDEVDRELDALAAPMALAGRWKTGLIGLRRMHAKLYNLLGDPAMRLAMPAAAIDDLRLDGDRIRGVVSGMRSGRVILTAETPRASLVHADRLIPPAGLNDPDLESKAANNYPLANDRVLTRMEGDVTDGRFEIVLGEKLPQSAAVLRTYAAGTDSSDHLFDAVGALRLTPPEAATVDRPKVEASSAQSPDSD
jgi:hypothetical protein